MQIAFIGLGAMGRHMATNLARGGHAVRGYDVRPDALAGVTAPGLAQVATLAEAVRGADAVLTSLPDTPDVESVLVGAGGAIEHVAPGALAVDFSTISPAATRRMAERFSERGVALLDAPVSGGVPGAEAGSLTIMVGGDAAAFARARPLLERVGRTINHFGPSGAGQAVKLCNQVMCTMHIQAVCEAFALGRAAGVDLGRLREALLGGAAASWILDHHGALILAKDDHPMFRIELQTKDLRLAAELAGSLRVPLPGLAQVLQLYSSALAHGEGGLGNQSLYRVYDRLTHQT
ncbi:MAG: NAD(P)-dependent oxidoreductase [Bacteroidota bacterium]|jgi:2-hydroxy-3-oxopropionate reductase